MTAVPLVVPVLGVQSLGLLVTFCVRPPRLFAPFER